MHYTPSTEDRQGVIAGSDCWLTPTSQSFGQFRLKTMAQALLAGERERIFEPFYRALGSNVDGSGLGLPIVREIAQRHGATVSVDVAHPGQTPPGACFTIRFARASNQFKTRIT
jgi:two-component system sensor histidine kinase TctE